MKHYKPSDLRFAHDSISDKFDDRRYTMEDTFKKLLNGDITCDQIAPFHVVKNGCKLLVAGGNRRLYLYKRLEEVGIVEEVPVKQEDRVQLKTKRTTKNGGQSVKIRSSGGSSSLEDRLNLIVKTWRKTRAANDVFGSGSSQEEVKEEVRIRKRGRGVAFKTAGPSRGSNEEDLGPEADAPAEKYGKGKKK